MPNHIIKGHGKTIELDVIKKPFSLKKQLSVVIPTYNEEENVEKIVKAVQKVLDNTDLKNNYEIIVADDDSKDNTPKIMDKLAKNKDIIALHRYKNRGLFLAELDAIKISNGNLVLTMDSDFSHPPELIPKLLSFSKNYDIVSASRFIKGGGMDAPLHRDLGSKILNRICGIIIGLSVKDLGGNFRLFNKEKFLKLKFIYPTVFGEFGFEIFKRAKQSKLKVKEVPFVYKFRVEGNSKMSNTLKYAIAYLKRAFELRFE